MRTTFCLAVLLVGAATLHAQGRESSGVRWSPAADSSLISDSSLIAFQKGIVLQLTGGADLTPGVTLQNRSSAENRGRVRAFLASALESLGLEAVRQPYREDGENVYALLPSTTDSDEYVVVGAHFDTVDRSPGASDNATGCAVVLGVARHLMTLAHRDKNVLVVFFDEEERGLVGSRAFAEMLVEEGRDVVAVHTVDQLGWDADGDGALELEIPYDGALDLYREVRFRPFGFPAARDAGSRPHRGIPERGHHPSHPSPYRQLGYGGLRLSGPWDEPGAGRDDHPAGRRQKGPRPWHGLDA